VTIRRLAQALGVTPMALYCISEQSELMMGIVDYVLTDLRATGADDRFLAEALRADGGGARHR